LAVRGGNDGLWDWNLASNRVHFAPRWIAMVGCEEHEVGHSPDEWLGRVHPEDRPEVRGRIDACLEAGDGEFSIRHRMLHKNGTYRWMACHAVVMRDNDGRAIRLMGSHTDVTAETVADDLTGLPNRLLFLDRLARAVERTRRRPELLFAVIVVDLDRPDCAPEPVGSGGRDLLLTAAARRLETCLQSGGEPASTGLEYVVSRVRGDQFGILLEGLLQVGDALVSGQRLLAEVLAPFSVGDREVFVQASAGIAVSVTGYSNAEDVLRDADTALHRAKALGKARCEVFDTALVDSTRTEVETEAELERALERHEFVLFYQPIVSLATNRIVGLEALVRWQHPSRGQVPPIEFIPLAEKTGLIVRLGAWTVKEACRQLAAWQKSLPVPRDFWVSVNLSGVQFRDPELFAQIGDAVRDAALDPRCLMVEVTESALIENPAAARGLIMQLRVLGIRVGLDDFGTGHSGLAYLHQFPADVLKVDRSFIRGIEARQDMADIIRTVNGLADQLGLEVIAEGIESEQQLDVIRSLRCGYVQGFLLARPLGGEQTEALLRSGLDLTPEARRVAEIGPSPEPAPGVASPVHQARSVTRRRVLAAAAVAATLLLVWAGLAVRATSGSHAPKTMFSPPALSVTHAVSNQPAEALVHPVASSPGVGARAGSLPSNETPRAAQQSATTAAPPKAGVRGPVAESFPAVHLHVLGSCTGRLVVSATGVSYVPDTSKDAFTLSYQAIQCALSGDVLTIKSDTRTYRFRAAKGLSAEDGRAQLQKAFDSITRQSQAQRAGAGAR
jgi:diguanylate cyclase (GGDEF)-like protein/PAS domain S-box-containing protein